MRYPFLMIVILFWSFGSPALHKDIVALIDKQNPAFKKVLHSASKPQARLILERYVELLSDSPFSNGKNLDKKELLDFITARFMKLEADEGELKKAKQLRVYSETVERGINHLIKAFDGRFRDDFLELNHDCKDGSYTFPFHIEGNEGNAEWSLIIHGINIPETAEDFGEEDRCLEVILNADVPTAELAWLGTVGTACPIPKEKAGECLLGLAEKIAESVGKKEMKLLDASQIRCKENKKMINLRRLRVYQGGQSWYEKMGYSTSLDKKDYKAALDKFRYYPLSQLQKNMASLEIPVAEKQAARLVKTRVAAFAEDHDDATISQFMSQLWDKDCAEYSIVDAFLEDLSIGTEISQFYPNNTYYRKTL